MDFHNLRVVDFGRETNLKDCKVFIKECQIDKKIAQRNLTENSSMTERKDLMLKKIVPACEAGVVTCCRYCTQISVGLKEHFNHSASSKSALDNNPVLRKINKLFSWIKRVKQDTPKRIFILYSLLFLIPLFLITIGIIIGITSLSYLAARRMSEMVWLVTSTTATTPSAAATSMTTPSVTTTSATTTSVTTTTATTTSATTTPTTTQQQYWDLLETKANNPRYKFYPVSSTYVTFKVKVARAALVVLTTEPHESNPMYEILIGSWGNTKSAIYKNRDESTGVERNTKNILNANQWRGFWMRWEGGKVEVGRETEDNPFMSWTDPEPFRVILPTSRIMNPNEFRKFLIEWKCSRLLVRDGTFGAVLMEWVDPAPFPVTHFGVRAGYGARGHWRITHFGTSSSL